MLNARTRTIYSTTAAAPLTFTLSERGPGSAGRDADHGQLVAVRTWGGVVQTFRLADLANVVAALTDGERL